MKSSKIGLSILAVMSIYSQINAESFSDAIVNGKVSGEVAATYENRDVEKQLTMWDNYYSDTNYSVGSLALKYETAQWYNISATAKFRGYATLFEGGKNEKHYKGYGDAAERFWETDGKKNSDLEELFLKYKLDNFSLITGRQAISTDWINKTHDAVRVGGTFGDTTIDGIWSYKHGRIYARDYRPMTETNDGRGVYKLDITHKFNQYLSASAYDFMAPDARDIYGGKLNFTLGDTTLKTHYAVNKDDKDSQKDSSLIEAVLSTTYEGFTPYLGYVQIDKDAGFTHMAGEIVNPFEEGDQIFLRGAQTYYLGLKKTFGDLTANVLYGITKYDESNDYSGRSGDYKKDELNLWLDYAINKDLTASLGYALTNEDSEEKKNLATTDLSQVNFTVVYKFAQK